MRFANTEVNVRLFRWLVECVPSKRMLNLFSKIYVIYIFLQQVDFMQLMTVSLTPTRIKEKKHFTSTC